MFFEYALNTFFTLEMLIKMFGFGLCNGADAYFATYQNTFDCIVVMVSWTLLLLDEYLDQYSQSEVKLLKLLRLGRLLRPFHSIASLRDTLFCIAAAVRALRPNMLILIWFLFLMGIFSAALLSGSMRQRCYDGELDNFFEPKGLTCSCSPHIGRQCSFANTGRHNATCEDSGDGPFARLQGQTPWFADIRNATAAVYANPEYGTLNFDAIYWSWLQIFQGWTGVGWTHITYKVIDANGRIYEIAFTLMHLLGDWFLINLMLAVVGNAYEYELDRRRAAALREAALRRERQLVEQRRLQMLQESGTPQEAGRHGMRMKKLGMVKAAHEAANAAAAHMVDPALGDTRVTIDEKAMRAAEHEGTRGTDRCCGVQSNPRMNRLRRLLRRTVDNFWFRLFIVAMILGNTAVAAMSGPFISKRYGNGELDDQLNDINLAFGIVFAVEALVKLFALGPRGYMKERLNVIDALIVLVFLGECLTRILMVSGLLELGYASETIFKLLRPMRMLRLINLARVNATFHKLFVKMARALRTVLPMTFVLVFLLYVLTVIALKTIANIFNSVHVDAELGPCPPSPGAEVAATDACARKPRSHFDNFPFAFATIFQLVTRDNWPTVMAYTYNAVGAFACVFCPLVIVLGDFVVVNLFLAILLANFSDANAVDDTFVPIDFQLWRNNSVNLLTRRRLGLGEGKRRVPKAPPKMRRGIAAMDAKVARWRQARRDAKAHKKAAEERRKARQDQSLIRRKKSKYGSLNAWEVAHLKRLFRRADVNGDGYLSLSHVRKMVADLGEEPAEKRTWELLLDEGLSNPEPHHVTLNEFLSFMSAKRAVESVGPGAEQQVSRAKQQLREAHSRVKLARRWGLDNHFTAPVVRLFGYLTRNDVIVDKLPPLGAFGNDVLGVRYSRRIQSFLYGRRYWHFEILLIIVSSIFLVSEIDNLVYTLRKDSGAPTLSQDRFVSESTVLVFDGFFIANTFIGILLKVMTEGAPFFRNGWNDLDLFCLFCQLCKIWFSKWRRFVLSLASVRIFMLVPRIREMRKITQAILFAMPNFVITVTCCMVIWVMFAISGVALFGGRSHACVALSTAGGLPGCGLAEGSRSYSDALSCRYQLAPSAVPTSIIPGATAQWQCGCDRVEVYDADGNYSIYSEGGKNCTAVTLDDGTEVAWLPAYPNFDDTGNAMLALFQISTLDNWANLMHFSMDGTGVGLQPQRETFVLVPILYYIAFILVGVLFIQNIFVGVVIDEFARMKKLYDGMSYLTEQQARWLNTQKLVARLRPDRNIALEPPSECRYRRLFFKLIHNARECGRPPNAPAEARYYGHVFERAVVIAILANTASFCLVTSPWPWQLRATFDVLNLVFVLLFTLEAGIKIVALTFREYFKERWNRFDLALVIFSLLSMAVVFVLDDLLGVMEPYQRRILMAVRALRIVRLMRVSKGLAGMMRTMVYASPAIFNILLVLIIFTFFYSQLGMTILGTLIYERNAVGFSRHANFETLTGTISSLLRLSTGDAWSAMMQDAVWNPHVSTVDPPPIALVYVYLITYVAMTIWVLVSITVAVILDNFNETHAEDGLSIGFSDIEVFARKWIEFDTQNTHWIDTLDLGLLLSTLGTPLVAVKERPRLGIIDDGGSWVRPTTDELEGILERIDCPEHGGKMHFLEVLLSLLQNVTGVVSEEQIMSDLLKNRPGYWESLRGMPKISGFSGDEKIKARIMAKLRDAIHKSGLAQAEYRYKQLRQASEALVRAKGSHGCSLSGSLSGSRSSGAGGCLGVEGRELRMRQRVPLPIDKLSKPSLTRASGLEEMSNTRASELTELTGSTESSYGSRILSRCASASGEIRATNGSAQGQPPAAIARSLNQRPPEVAVEIPSGRQAQRSPVARALTHLTRRTGPSIRQDLEC